MFTPVVFHACEPMEHRMEHMEHMLLKDEPFGAIGSMFDSLDEETVALRLSRLLDKGGIRFDSNAPKILKKSFFRSIVTKGGTIQWFVGRKNLLHPPNAHWHVKYFAGW